MTQSAQPAVSVALCTYNGEQYLVEQLESILAQDYAHVAEIICVDDNSTDTTPAILQKYADKHPGIRFFRNDHNLGFIRNFEKAVTLATSPLIAIADQDDIWYPHKISKLVQAIGSSYLVYSDNDYIDAGGKKIGLRFSDKRNLLPIPSCLSFALFNVISGHTALFKKTLLDTALPFPEDVYYDWWLAYRAADLAPVAYVDEPLVGYRQHVSNAVGGYGIKKENKKVPEFVIYSETEIRLKAFVNDPHKKQDENRAVFAFLLKSYTDKSLKMRFARIALFLKHREALLLFKKRSTLRKQIYCLKAFWKYD